MFTQLALALTLPGHYAAHIVVSPDYYPLHMFSHRIENLFFSVLARRVVKLSDWMFCTRLCLRMQKA